MDPSSTRPPRHLPPCQRSPNARHSTTCRFPLSAWPHIRSKTWPCRGWWSCGRWWRVVQSGQAPFRSRSAPGPDSRETFSFRDIRAPFPRRGSCPAEREHLGARDCPPPVRAKSPPPTSSGGCCSRARRLFARGPPLTPWKCTVISLSFLCTLCFAQLDTVQGFSPNTWSKPRLLP